MFGQSSCARLQPWSGCWRSQAATLDRFGAETGARSRAPPATLSETRSRQWPTSNPSAPPGRRKFSWVTTTVRAALSRGRRLGVELQAGRVVQDDGIGPHHRRLRKQRQAEILERARNRGVDRPVPEHRRGEVHHGQAHVRRKRADLRRHGAAGAARKAGLDQKGHPWTRPGKGGGRRRVQLDDGVKHAHRCRVSRRRAGAPIDLAPAPSADRRAGAPWVGQAGEAEVGPA